MKLSKISLSWLVMRLIAYLPLEALYLFSRIIYFVLFRIAAYRRQVVRRNLSYAFPRLSIRERNSIARRFYLHFSRILVENIKLLDFKPDDLFRRIKFTNPEILEEYYSRNVSVAAIAAHYCNWEWLLGLRPMIPHEAYAVYKPLSNKTFNEKLNELRCSFGGKLIHMRETIRVLKRSMEEQTPSLAVFIADQSPVWEETQFWLEFLNRPTAVYTGPEKIARQLDMAVVYFRMKPADKGKYEVTIIPVTDHPREEKPFDITLRYTKLIEDTIRQSPEYWLWSHNRWKLTDRRIREESKGIYKFKGNYRRNEK